MFSSPDGLNNDRMQALNFLQKGEETFTKSKGAQNKLKGFQLYKKGIEMMIKYARNEQNPIILSRLKEKIKEWLSRAENMQSQIYPSLFENDAKPNQENQSNLGPRARFEHPDKPRVGPTQPPLFSRDNKKNQPNEADSKLMSSLQDTLLMEKPNVKWEDIVGLEQAKNTLREAVIYPIKFPQLFVGNRTPWKGILLYGPPGTGKTFLAKACATEAQASFFSVSSADIMSKYVGESEKLVKNLFTLARQNKPAIIFIDEIDSLLSSRKDDENEAFRRVKTEFLVQMQGVGKDDTGILILGATNRPWDLDPAVRRRFEKRIYIPLPDRPARRALLMKQFEKTPHSLRPEDIQFLAIKTEGYSGADINILVRDACFEPIRNAQNATHFRVIDKLPDGLPVYQPCHPEDPGAQAMGMFSIPGPQLRLKNVTLEDFQVALQKTKPSVGASDLALQEDFTKDYGIEG